MCLYLDSCVTLAYVELAGEVQTAHAQQLEVFLRDAQVDAVQVPVYVVHGHLVDFALEHEQLGDLGHPVEQDRPHVQADRAASRLVLHEVLDRGDVDRHITLLCRRQSLSQQQRLFVADGRVAVERVELQVLECECRVEAGRLVFAFLERVRRGFVGAGFQLDDGADGRHRLLSRGGEVFWDELLLLLRGENQVRVLRLELGLRVGRLFAPPLKIERGDETAGFLLSAEQLLASELVEPSVRCRAVCSSSSSCSASSCGLASQGFSKKGSCLGTCFAPSSHKDRLPESLSRCFPYCRVVKACRAGSFSLPATP